MAKRSKRKELMFWVFIIGLTFASVYLFEDQPKNTKQNPPRQSYSNSSRANFPIPHTLKDMQMQSADFCYAYTDFLHLVLVYSYHSQESTSHYIKPLWEIYENNICQTNQNLSYFLLLPKNVSSELSDNIKNFMDAENLKKCAAKQTSAEKVQSCKENIIKFCSHYEPKLKTLKSNFLKLKKQNKIHQQKFSYFYYDFMNHPNCVKQFSQTVTGN